MIYDEHWVPPWREGLPQARCEGKNCTPDGLPGNLVVAITLTNGLCASCNRDAENDRREL